MKKKAFIFDLDGVIVDTAKYHYLAWQKLAAELGINFTPEHNEELKGVSRVRSLEIIMAMGNVTASTDQINLWLDQKNTDYLSYIESMDESEILPGVLPILNFLKENGQPIALGSASKNARPILEKVHILSYFDVIIDGNDVTQAKPDPEVFTRAADGLQMAYADAIVFEDSVAGVQAARHAHMTSVGIGDAQILKEADYHFPDFTHFDHHFIETLIQK
ncbi:MAG: beta-phosphoglucomutase [Flavobacterium sp. BFFFF2]|nr:MAG: beta-phosphoglucomutase [Flavobacterium sp. BFFFF2]